jgi:hypothetical protein
MMCSRNRRLTPRKLRLRREMTRMEELRSRRLLMTSLLVSDTST